MSDYRIGRLHDRYVVSWWVDGKRRRHRLDALTAKEAEAEAIDVIRREQTKPVGATVAALWDAYRKEKDGRPIAETMKHEWKALGPQFGHLRPDQITVDACRDYVALRREQGRKDGTIWTELGHLRIVLKWALGEKAPRIERPSQPAPKERYLTRAEIQKLLAAPMAPHIRLAILLMLSTAGRVSAILELKWDRVDFERGQINLRTDETGPRKGRAVVPMNAGLRAALTAAKKAALSDYVIEWAGERVGSIKKGFAAAVKAAELDDVTPHCLRHTAAVHLAASGTSMSRISQYLGHSNSSITERVYARFAPDHLRDEAAILDFATVREAV